MKLLEEHPWMTRFLGIEVVLVVLSVVLIVVTGPSSTDAITWDPFKVTGLLLGAWAVMLAAFGVVAVIGYAIWTRR